MTGFIIWLVGFVLGIKAALEIYKLNGDLVKKILFIVVLLCASWVGLVVYYFFAREKVAQWVK